jgi:molecular chaperone GrpE
LAERAAPKPDAGPIRGSTPHPWPKDPLEVVVFGPNYVAVVRRCAPRARHAARIVDPAFIIQFDFSDMENTQENPAGQPADETGRDATAAQAPAGDAPQAAAADAALAEAQAKVAELQESFLRAKAETENVRRRAQDDVAKAHKFAIEGFAEHLLPVIDSLEAAVGDKSDDIAKIREGVELTLRQLQSALEKGRVNVIDPVGAKFDPHQHQAISMVPAEQEPNTVVSVLQKGYTIADRVLRPALVTVAQPK